MGLAFGGKLIEGIGLPILKIHPIKTQPNLEFTFRSFKTFFMLQARSYSALIDSSSILRVIFSLVIFDPNPPSASSFFCNEK